MIFHRRFSSAWGLFRQLPIEKNVFTRNPTLPLNGKILFRVPFGRCLHDLGQKKNKEPLALGFECRLQERKATLQFRAEQVSVTKPPARSV